MVFSPIQIFKRHLKRKFLVVTCGAVLMLMVIYHLLDQSSMKNNVYAGDKATEHSLTISQCTKRKNVAFLKVHKAGSSTVQNIFLRFAARYKLNVVLPKHNERAATHYLAFRKTVEKEKIIPIPDNETYNILCNHVVYEKKAFDAIMPSGSTYIGIIREPQSQFISSFLYYGLDQLKFYGWPKDDPAFIMERFLANPSWYVIPNFHFLHNSMSFDFGLKFSSFRDENAIEKFIQNIESDFSLIMIVEYFDESLILLKRRLCWEIRDILYHPINVNKEINKQEISMTPKTQENLRNLNFADFKLYDHFKSRFLRELNKERDDFQEELQNFQNIQSSVTNFCSEHRNDSLFVQQTKWNSAFSFSKQHCVDIMRPEVNMIRTFINKAYAKYNNWVADKKRKLKTSKRH